MEWMRRVTEIGVLIKNDDDAGRKGTFRALESSDILWAAWSDDGRTPSIRVIRGRSLVGPDLKHGVLLCDHEEGALEFGENWGDEIPLMKDGKTLNLPKPAVPRTHIEMMMSHRVLLFDGTQMDFNVGADYWEEEG